MDEALEIAQDTARPLGRARSAALAAFFVDGFVFATWVSRIPVIQDHLHLSNVILGFTLLMSSIGAIIAMPICGMIVGRCGSKLVAPLSLCAFCMSLMLPGFATGVITLGIALGLFGFAFGAVDVAINAQAVAVEHLYDRPIMGTFHALFSMGGMTGAGVGCMAAWAGLSPGWHFVIVSIVLLIPSILIYTWLIAEKTPHHHTGAITKNQTRALSFLGAIAFCTALGEGAMGDWSGVYLRQVSHSTAPVAALGFAAFSLAMTVGRFLADRFTARLGPMNMVRVSSAVAAAGLILAMLHPTILFAIIGFTCVGAGLAALIPIVFSAAGRTAGVKPSVAIASVAATGYFGFLAGPPVIGVASKFVTLRWTLFLVVIGCGVAIALAHQVQRPVPDRSL